MGFTYSDSVNLLVIMNGIGIPSRIASGHIADRYFGVLNTIIPVAFINVLLIFCWLAVSNRGGLYTFVCLYGLLSAAIQSVIPTTVASLTTDLRKTGTRLGMVFSVISFAALTGPPIGGALLSADGGKYLPAQIWAGASMLLSAFFLMGARVSKYGWKQVKC